MAKIIVENFKLENHVNLPEADARAAFARIRHNVVRKQMQTLEKAGQQSTQAYKTAKSLYARKPSQMTKNEIYAALAKYAAWNRSGRTVKQVKAKEAAKAARITKQEKRAVRTLKRHGYKNLEESDMKAFGKYMRAWEDNPDLAMYDSGRVAALYDELKAMGMLTPTGRIKQAIKKNFSEWLNRQPRLKDFAKWWPATHHGKMPSANDLDAAYQEWEKKHFGGK